MPSRSQRAKTSPARSRAWPIDEDAALKLTREQAAKLLHVSPAYVDELVRLGHLAWFKADTHDGQSGQLLAEAAVQAYRRASRRRQAKGLGKMVEASERLRLYDEGETEVPARRSSGALVWSRRPAACKAPSPAVTS
jgi:hypothetical protein